MSTLITEAFWWMGLGTMLISFSLTSLAGDRPKFGPQAKRLFFSHDYITQTKAPDFWSLTPYYVSQRDGKSCSLASVAMLLNSLRAHRGLTASDELVTQDELFKKANHPVWNEGLGLKGKGVTLDQLGAVVLAVLPLYGVHGMVKIERVDNDTEVTLKKVRELLIKNEASDKNFIIANFLQSEFTGDSEGAIGHIAPVGAYDSKRDRVLIFDPDRKWYEPYWVSLKTFVKGLATKDSVTQKNRGLVWVERQ